MIFVIDSNVFFSALIKNSIVRKIILESGETFLFPEYVFEEFKEHKEEIIRKSRLSKEEFYHIFKRILLKVKIVKNEVLKDYGEEALEIIGSIDEDDALYIACALAYPGSAIWSDDKHFKMQDRVRVFYTKEMINFIG